MWQSFYASEGTSRTTVYIPLSALCSVVLCIAIGFLPTEWLVVCGVIVLPALGAWTLRKSLAEVVPYEAEPLTRERRLMLLRDMARPVFCVCAIGFVWKMIGYVVPQGNLGSFEGIMLGMSCATLVVAAIELFTERGFDMLRVYQVLFPLITGVFLLPTFFGIEWLGAVSVFTMFGFEVVNLLLLITCAAYASARPSIRRLCMRCAWPHAREFAFGRFGGAGCRCAYSARFHARGRRAVRVRVCAYGGALFGIAWPQQE